LVRLVGAALEEPEAGGVLGAEQHHHGAAAGGDRARELGDQMLRPLPADRLEDRARGVSADTLRNRPRVVVRLAQRRGRPSGNLELPDAGDRARQRRQFDRRHAAVGGVADVFGRLSDAHDDRRPRIDHYRPPDGC